MLVTERPVAHPWVGPQIDAGAAMEAMPGGIVQVRPDGAITAANAEAQRLLGLSLDEMTGRYVSDWRGQTLREDGSPCPVEDLPVARCLRTGRPQPPMTIGTRRPDGDILWAVYRAVPMLDAPAGALVSFVDITDRKRAEAIKAGQTRALELLATGGSLGQVLETLARTVEEHSPGLLCSVLLLDNSDPDAPRLRHGAAPSLPADYNRAVHGLGVGPAAGSCGTAAFRGERVIVEDIATDPLWAPWREIAMGHGLRSCWSLPIRDSQGRVVGTFAVYRRQPHRPEEEELQLIAGLAHLAGVAIERRRDEEALRQSEEHFRQAAESNRRLLQEVNHRVRNNLASLLSLISITRRRFESVPEFAAALEARVMALAQIHNLLAESHWSDLDLGALMERVLTSVKGTVPRDAPVTLKGPAVRVSPRQSLPLTLTLLELLTNSCKHGAHSAAGGAVEITWTVEPHPRGSLVRLRWRETGGPAREAERPVRPSLGTELIHGFIGFELGGRCELRYTPGGADHCFEFIAGEAGGHVAKTGSLRAS